VLQEGQACLDRSLCCVALGDIFHGQQDAALASRLAFEQQTPGIEQQHLVTDTGEDVVDFKIIEGVVGGQDLVEEGS
jgi:hypothetical protein